MTLDGRLQKLEAAAGPPGPIVIRVCRLPPEAMALDGQEQDAWVRAHPECVSKTVEVTDGVVTGTKRRMG